MGVNKVVYGDRTLIDLTETTVTPETLAEGATAMDSSGEIISGTLKVNSTNLFLNTGTENIGLGTLELTV